MSLAEFTRFHNEVLNLPRDSFSNFDIGKIKSLAEYLCSIRSEFPTEGLRVIEIYLKIHSFLQTNTIQNPNGDFETLFSLELLHEDDIREFYNGNAGRKFRHWMELAGLVELLANTQQGNKRILTPFTEEFFLIPVELTLPLLRDKILSINTNSNPCIENLGSFRYYQNLDFRPAKGILKYLFELKRPCTRFELAVFFGRPNHLLNTEDEIIEEAINVGAAFPTNQSDQIEYYFRLKNWVDGNGEIYPYAASQQPYFKFNSFFILMASVGLINYDIRSNFITLSDFSVALFTSDVTPETVELTDLLNNIDNIADSTLSEKITKNRATIIKKLLSNDANFLLSLNLRASRKSGRSVTVKETTKWQRDELAREVSKQLSNYTCQGCRKETFIDKSGNNFVESHHIIEYNSKEEGPDVLQNLLVLCPNCHSKIHFARIDIVTEFYQDLRRKGIITLNQFIDIHNSLRALKTNHIQILHQKSIINEVEVEELTRLISGTV